MNSVTEYDGLPESHFVRPAASGADSLWHTRRHVCHSGTILFVALNVPALAFKYGRACT